MLRRAVFLSLFLAAPAASEPMQADAFGLFPAGSDVGRGGWAGLRTPFGGDGAVQIVAPGPVDRVLLVFGEKSLVAGDDVAQIAALLLDADGNPVADGTPVRLSAADGTVIRPSRNGIASRPVSAGPMPGRHHAWAASSEGGGLRQSDRVMYRVGTGLAGLATELVPPADVFLPEDTARVDAMPLRAADGSLPEDGIAGALLLRHADGSISQIPATWVGGSLEAPFLTRDIAGPAWARLQLPFVETPEVEISIARLAPGGPLAVRALAMPDIGATRLVLGPFTTATGHLLHDGSPVTLRARDAGGRVFAMQAWVLDGMVSVTVPSDALPVAFEAVSPRGTDRASVAEVER